MTRLLLSLLGPIQVTLDGKSITGFESNKVRALLVYLAVEADRAHPRSVVAGLLWPDFDERTALGNLRNALANLRKAIGDREAQPPFLRIDNEVLQFNPASDHVLDVRDFVEDIDSDDIDWLRHAITLCRGAFLEGFALADSVPFEEWLVLKREQLGRLMLRALRRLADHYEQAGQYDLAQQYAWRQVTLEPWQEEGHQQLMRTLVLGGQRAAALAQYETCRRLLADELGVEPSPETTALYECIRDGLLTTESSALALPAFLNPQARPADINRPLFVAREAELARLDGVLTRVLDGHGQVLFITGEPGSGKTMLMQEFTRRALGAYPALIAVGGNCNAYSGLGDPYLPFLEILDMLTGDVEARWAAGAITREHACRLWALLPDAVRVLADQGVDLIDRFVLGTALRARAQVGAPFQVTALDELLQQKTMSAAAANSQQTNLFEQYTKVLHILARRRPLMLMVDDLQWADTGSISLLFHLGRRLKGQRILLVGAYRPGEITAGRDGDRHPLEPVLHELQRDYGDTQVDLSQAQGRLLIDALLDSEPNCLGATFRETLYHHTGGHPLFTVELLRGLQGRGDLTKDDSGRWVEGPVLDWETLPPRVEAVIAETVNRLPAALQTVLAVASVEGEFFTAQTLARIQAVDEQEIVQCLSGPLSKEYQLVSAAGIQRPDGQPLSRYRFRHFLFQKYLYNRLDAVQRAYLHEEMGRALETLYAAQLPELAAQLARHFEIAGLIAPALKYLQLAGDRAVRLFANAEAIALFRHALSLVSTLPDALEWANQELQLRIALRIPLEAVYGYTADEVAQNNVRARELTQQAEVSPDLFWVLTGLANYYLLRLSLRSVRELNEQMLLVARRLENPALLVGACHSRSITALYEGHFDTYFEYRQQAHALYNPERHRAEALQLDVDPEAGGLAHEGWAYWIHGYPDRARQQSQAAVALADEIGHPFTMGLTRFFAAQMYCYLRDASTTQKLAEATVALAREKDMATWLNAGSGMIDWALIETGHLAEGVVRLERTFSQTIQLGGQMGRAMDTPMLAEAYARVGRIGEGLALLDEGLHLVQETGFRMVESDLYRSKGDLLLANGSAEAAEACYWQAIESARRIEAKSWELRAALRLSRLWQWQGKISAARDLLSSIYGWFSEGLDTPDLQEACALLEALAQQSCS